MKKTLCLCTVLLAVLMIAVPGFTEEEDTELPELYRGRLRLSAKLYEDFHDTTGINHFSGLPKGERVIIHAVYPSFVYVTGINSNRSGYVNRLCVETYETPPVRTGGAERAPFGVEFNYFYACVSSDNAPVYNTDKNETLITLHRGAVISVIGFTEGYAKVIYHRQYGYIDSNCLDDLVCNYEDAEDAGYDYPIASYTSFYKITEDESNQNRIKNIHAACDKMNVLTIGTGSVFDFNKLIGPYSRANGYYPATVLVDGEGTQGYGGGTCQVSSTLYNVVLQLPGLTVTKRRPHGDNGASYLPIGMDAAVGNSILDFAFRNDYDFPIRIFGCAQDGALTIAIYKAK